LLKAVPGLPYPTPWREEELRVWELKDEASRVPPSNHPNDASPRPPETRE
jgi:hypothetical protein